ncbi:SEC-C metal-binding domain-containing protein [Pseudomonas sp. FIP_A4]|uniref:SEC-C metal-binding domain-containing protein n=1 Tax=Pseudomonas sp. FIP_A4 TaxID=3070684 RepID=UPI002FD2AB6E
MNNRSVMTDVEFCSALVPDAGEHYGRALDVMSAYPDYASAQFRIVIEHLVIMLIKRFRLDVEGASLYEMINELFSRRVIDYDLRSELHAIRIAGNAVVHSGMRHSNGAEGTTIRETPGTTAAGDRQSAVEARKTLIQVFQRVFGLLNRGIDVPVIHTVEVGDFTSQQILWKAVTTMDFEAKMAAGLILEAQSMGPINTNAIVIGYGEDAHRKTTLRMAAELYWAACELSAKLDRFALGEIESKGGKEKCLFKLANTEALYRYAMLTVDANEGEESHRLGVKALEVAAKRNYPPACVQYADLLRQEGKYQEALRMLETALANGELSAHAGLAFLYLEQDSSLYSPESAEKCLQDAIDRGCNHSEYLLGRWLYEGERLVADKERGLQLLERAAEAGHAQANFYTQHIVGDKLAKRMQLEFLNLLSALGPAADAPTQNRNESCLCGSGKKYKKCCYLKRKIATTPSRQR